MLKFAITGNIASGKSVVEDFIKAEGFEVYDTDKIAHKILENSSEVKNLFGTTERAKIANIVFSNNEMLKKLENIIHPKVKKELEQIFLKEKNTFFVSVPQLFEAGFDTMFDKIIFVAADENIRLERLIKRNNLTQEEALLRIRAQKEESEKISKSDFVINNNEDLDSLKKQVKNILNIC